MPNDRDSKRISKFLSLVLRHEPQKIGLEALEPGGFVAVATLLEGLKRHGFEATRADLDRIVQESDKQRFAYDETGTRIRCNQGHSVPVDLQLSPAVPPAVLYHGTPDTAVEAILADGLQKMSRHAVHLSADISTATIVGRRRGKATILRIDAAKMSQDGFTFYRSENGVWLVEAVPPIYLRRI
ncbi:MAG: RNA 2'-phosphotransferase [Fimbriimonas sp.]